MLKKLLQMAPASALSELALETPVCLHQPRLQPSIVSMDKEKDSSKQAYSLLRSWVVPHLVARGPAEWDDFVAVETAI
jgi:hypothetical protein